VNTDDTPARPTTPAPARRNPSPIAPPGTIAPYLRDIGRGKEGARSLSREQALDLMSRLLDGQLSELELGGFALAMRVKGESADELAAFVEAAQQRVITLPAADRAVLLPSYNGARKQPNLTPLLAHLLAREGVPVLVHGLPLDPGRVTSAQVFDALGLAPCTGAEGVADCWARGEPVFLSMEHLCPPLARLLALRRVLGLRNSGHTMAKILPALPGALRVVNHTHQEYADSLTEFLVDTHADALLMRGTEGEPVADARRQPRMDLLLGGQVESALSVPAHEGVLTELPALPKEGSAASTAQYIQSVISGAVPVPAPVRRQCDLLTQAAARLGAGPASSAA
jgi:anthranilate phosphoribosyltransferase